MTLRQMLSIFSRDDATRVFNYLKTSGADMATTAENEDLEFQRWTRIYLGSGYFLKADGSEEIFAIRKIKTGYSWDDVKKCTADNNLSVFKFREHNVSCIHNPFGAGLMSNEKPNFFLNGKYVDDIEKNPQAIEERLAFYLDEVLDEDV